MIYKSEKQTSLKLQLKLEEGMTQLFIVVGGLTLKSRNIPTTRK